MNKHICEGDKGNHRSNRELLIHDQRGGDPDQCDSAQAKDKPVGNSERNIQLPNSDSAVYYLNRCIGIACASRILLIGQLDRKYSPDAFQDFALLACGKRGALLAEPQRVTSFQD